MPEVLIATAITAGLLTATATAVGTVVRLSTATTARAHALDEMELITARLRAGMNDDDALEGLPGWRLTHRPFESEADNSGQTPFEITTATFGNDDFIKIEILTPRREISP